jgi:hypothetical protein
MRNESYYQTQREQSLSLGENIFNLLFVILLEGPDFGISLYSLFDKHYMWFLHSGIRNFFSPAIVVTVTAAINYSESLFIYSLPILKVQITLHSEKLKRKKLNTQKETQNIIII